jgi:Zn-dependent M28 family amino/carboxypeptidase
MRWLALLLFAHAAAADPFDKTQLHDDVAFLASKQLDGRAPGTEGDKKARAFVEARFKSIGLTPAGDDGDFAQAFTTDGKTTANVIGFVAGTGDDIVMVSAHLDHLGDGHLGANDDASGVAALLAIAQSIKDGDPPNRTIVFAAFGAEEDGMIGSGFYASHPAKNLPLANVVQFVELDMIGSHSSADLVAAMGAFKGFGARTLLDKRLKEFPHIHVSAGGKARGSDFEPFCKLGVPYTFFWTPDHRCYHERCDTIDRLDLPHMVDIAKLAGELVRDLADTDLDLAKLRAKKGCGV